MKYITHRDSKGNMKTIASSDSVTVEEALESGALDLDEGAVIDLRVVLDDKAARALLSMLAIYGEEEAFEKLSGVVSRYLKDNKGRIDRGLI